VTLNLFEDSTCSKTKSLFLSSTKMKFVSAALALLGCASFALAQDVPVQTFFIPLPEQELFEKTFNVLNSVASGKVNTMLSFTTSIDGTIIWYDHWEDGFEDEIVNPTKATTEIWGDGDCSNGWYGQHTNPTSSCNSASDDTIDAGTAIVIQNDMTINPRDKNDFFFDGMDRVHASFPIAVTRAAYPDNPGSLMAGAVEVLEMESWGTDFKAPVGHDITGHSGAFEHSAFYMMAGEDQTKITIYPKDTSKDSYSVTINKGDNYFLEVEQNDAVKADKPIQVHLLTGDIGSTYELRWFSLIPAEEWSTAYLSPVGDVNSMEESTVLMYNPRDYAITVTITVKGGSSYTKTIPAESHTVSNVIPNNSGAYITSSNPEHLFVAFSMTDTDSDGNGQIFDWGCPLMPVGQLTPQVLIGLGYGCTDKNCWYDTSKLTEARKERSQIWITCMEDCKIYVDRNNNGTPDEADGHNAVAFESKRFDDTSDNDMSGAIIYATKQDGTGHVNIAAAWGQNSYHSYSGDNQALDMGTVVLPYPRVRVTKIGRNIGPGTNGPRMLYTILVQNLGQTDITANSYKVSDPALANMIYIAGSTTYSLDGGVTTTPITDNQDPTTDFPLDENWYTIPVAIPRRGGTFSITFEVEVVPNVVQVENSGKLIPTDPDTPELPFYVQTPLARVQIDNTVYRHHVSEDSCKVPGYELVVGEANDDVTYCFKVKNTGLAHLKDVTVTNAQISGFTTQVHDGILPPGGVWYIRVPNSIAADLVNTAVVEGMPVDHNGDYVQLANVTDSDPSAVQMFTIPVSTTAC